jgi:3-oxoacyl-[acyl-carrier protein] reductase
MDLSGKVAIVTGGSQGIGRAIAIELAKAGANIVLYDVNSKEGRKVAREIEKMGQRALFVKGDVSKRKDVEKMLGFALNQFGKIDIFVNNAGISGKKPGGKRVQINAIEEREWERVMDVNLKGVFICTKAVMGSMMKQRSGKIVNIASIAGLIAGSLTFSGAHYAVSKAAVIAFTKVSAMELAPYGITVNAIAPGRIETEMTGKISPDTNEMYKKRIPLGRFGKPEEIAKAVAFLVSDSAEFITGATLAIDGGVVMH